MEAGRISSNMFACLLLHFLLPTCPATLNTISSYFLLKLQLYFIIIVKTFIYELLGFFGHSIERKENFWQKRYQYFGK